ncbi:MAG: heme exporter protein CcmD [Cellvibrionaceae bacterium]
MQFQFDSLQAFLHMQGHGFYVWLAYGVSLAALGFIALYPIFRKHSFIREQAKQQQLDEALRQESSEVTSG